jgi:uncharacterized protein (DUF302 family)
MHRCCIGQRHLLQKESTMNTTYGFGTTLQISHEETIPRVKGALKAKGFVVLTKI